MAKIKQPKVFPSYLLNDFHIRVDVAKKETRCKPNHIKFFENEEKKKSLVKKWQSGKRKPTQSFKATKFKST